MKNRIKKTKYGCTHKGPPFSANIYADAFVLIALLLIVL